MKLREILTRKRDTKNDEPQNPDRRNVIKYGIAAVGGLALAVLEGCHDRYHLAENPDGSPDANTDNDGQINPLDANIHDGGNSDAGNENDSGVDLDSGLQTDSGTNNDAGNTIDSGTGPDAIPTTETNCTDTADEDQDGKVGCVDIDCQNDPSCTIYTRNCSTLPTGDECNVGPGFPCSPLGECSEYDICVCPHP